MSFSNNSFRQKALVQRGEQEGLVRFEPERVYYPKSDFRTPLTPEEEVRIEAYLKLIFQYRYPPQRIAFEYQVKMGSSYRRIDLIVFDDNQRSKLFIIGECKRAEVGKNVFEEAVAQAKSYDRQLYAEYLWVTSGERDAYYKTRQSKSERSYFELPDIPAFGRREQWSYRLQEALGIVWQQGKQFYSAYIHPQFQRPWVARWLLYSGVLLVLGLVLSWIHSATLSPFVVKQTRWLYHISFKELYAPIPIVATLLAVGIFRRSIVPDGITSARGKKKHRRIQQLYLLASVLIMLPAFLVTGTFFGIEGKCVRCCAEEWACWWSYNHYKQYSASYRFLQYFVPQSLAVLPQGFAMLLVGWSFKAFERINR